MCGIAGIAIKSQLEWVDRQALKRMADSIRHRGPDDEGIFVAPHIGLAHRRLSIVDVASGHQPMTNEDGSLHITYNGEIYNHADFREELEEKGHVYKTHCDTETILHLYEEHGDNCVEYLRGMFAFGLWDANRRRLLLARDRLGVKPLYYAHLDDGSLYFASEIKAILRVWNRKPEVNFAVLPDYLANHAPSGADTMFKGIRRLPAGHILTWQDGRIEIQKYWDVHFATNGNERSDESYIEEWTEMFRTSVRLRLMADVPLGMFLSGGIDSSAIAAFMSKMVSEPIKTFSVAFREREANELEYARLVARSFNTDHHEIVVTPEQFFDALPKLTWHEDEPIAHLASIPLYFVSVLAGKHVKVVLTGEGSDEMLAGYARYRKTVYNLALGARYEQFLPGILRQQVQTGLEHLSKGSKIRQKLSRTFLALSSNVEDLYFDNFAVFSRVRQSSLFSESTCEQVGDLDPYFQMRQYFDDTDADSLLNKLLYVDTKTYLQELLMKQDQMSMAASIESRVPFLDHKLVEFTARLPERLKLRGWTTKYILRRSMKGILPEEILNRRKMGFPVPLGRWLREDYRNFVDEYVLSDRVQSRNIFDRRAVEQLAAEHERGVNNHADRLWALITFEVWLRQFIDGEDLPSYDVAESTPALIGTT